MSVVNDFTKDVILAEYPNDLLEICFIAKSVRDDDEFIEYSNLLNSKLRTNHQFESLDVSISLMLASNPSIEESPTLPAYLRYTFLQKSLLL